MKVFPFFKLAVVIAFVSVSRKALNHGHNKTRNQMRNNKPSVGTTTDTQPAGDHMYSLLFPVQTASRGCFVSHWKAKTKEEKMK